MILKVLYMCWYTFFWDNCHGRISMLEIRRKNIKKFFKRNSPHLCRIFVEDYHNRLWPYSSTSEKSFLTKSQTISSWGNRCNQFFMKMEKSMIKSFVGTLCEWNFIYSGFVLYTFEEVTIIKKYIKTVALIFITYFIDCLPRETNKLKISLIKFEFTIVLRSFPNITYILCD